MKFFGSMDPAYRTQSLALLGVVILGGWIGALIARGGIFIYPALLAGGILATVVLFYLAKGFVDEIIGLQYAAPIPYLLPLVILYLAVQAAFPDIERRLFWGEVFALLLLPSIVRVQYLHPAQRRVVKMAHFMLFGVPIFTILYTLIFWSEEYNAYFMLRHLAVSLYIIFFFAAYKYGGMLLEIMARFFWVPFVLLTPGLGLWGMDGFIPMLNISAIGGTVLFAWMYLGYVHSSYSFRRCLVGFAVLVASIFLLSLRATNIVVIVTLLLFFPYVRLLKYWHHFVPLSVRKLVICVGIVTSIGLFGFMLFFLGKEIQENVIYKIGIMQIPGEFGLGEIPERGIGASLIWRLSFWAYLINRFLDHPFGIGLGTPIFEESLRAIMSLGITEVASVEYQTYTIAAHNSFITMLLRYGVIFLIPLGVCSVAMSQMFSQYWRLCRYSPLSTLESRVVFGSIIAFVVVVINAMFNVVIETPLYAALFWFSFGLMTRLVGDYIAANHWSHVKLVTALRTA